VSPVIVERADNPGDQSAQRDVIAELLIDKTIYEDFDPGFVRPPPAVTQLFPGELAGTFVASFGHANFLFDDN
jgi:hypothetical protein